jgi:sensor histidine kinase regulating citrate/malate metabolism
MEKAIHNNIITIKILNNYEPIIAYLYLMIIEYISNRVFVPSINPPENNIYIPENFTQKEYILSYFKTVKFKPQKSGAILTFTNANEANKFYEELEHTW